MNDDVLTRNSDEELALRVVSSDGDTGTDKNDVYTRDQDGKLAVRVVGGTGGGGGGGLTSVEHDDTLTGAGTTGSPLGVATPIPGGGTVGQVLTKTSQGVDWQPVPTSGGGTEIDWDKAVDYDGDGNTTTLYLVANLGPLANGRYSFYLKTREGNLEFKCTKICRIDLNLTEDGSTTYGRGYWVFNGETTASQDALWTYMPIDIPIRRTADGDILILPSDYFNIGSTYGYYDGTGLSNILTISKITNVDNEETFSAKELKCFINSQLEQFDSYKNGNDIGVCTFPGMYQMLPPVESLYQGGHTIQPNYMLELLSFDNRGSVCDIILSLDDKITFVRFTRMSHNVFYKTVLKNELGFTVKQYMTGDTAHIVLMDGPASGYLTVETNVYGCNAGQSIVPVSYHPTEDASNYRNVPDLGISRNLDVDTITGQTLGQIVQYVGDTNNGYVNGYFYKATGTPAPAHAEITSITGTGSVEDPDGYIAQRIRETAGYNSPAVLYVESGGIGVGPQPEGEGLWFYISLDEATENGVVVDGEGNFNYQYYPLGATISDPKWERVDVQPKGINADAALYAMTSLSSLFQYSDAKLAKVYNESRLPTTGAYTVLSLGWTYTDSENAPTLLATDLATGKFYYYHGTEENCTASAWKEFSFGAGGAGGSDNNGLEGDYATTYGISDETKSGLPYIKAVGSRTVVFPAEMVLDIPGVSGLTTLTSDIEYEVQSTDNPELFLLDTPINGSRIIESTDIFFSETEPENGVTGYAVWWDGGKTFKVKSNDTGNVWRPANAVRVAKTVFTDGSLTRLCFTGCRVLNKQEYLSSNGGNVNPDSQIVFESFISSSYDGVIGLGRGRAANVFGLGNHTGIWWGVNVANGNFLCAGSYSIGQAGFVISNVYTEKLNNGADIAVPTTGGTMVVATPPTDDGTYVLKTTVANGTITTEWVAE